MSLVLFHPAVLLKPFLKIKKKIRSSLLYFYCFNSF